MRANGSRPGEDFPHSGQADVLSLESRPTDPLHPSVSLLKASSGPDLGAQWHAPHPLREQGAKLFP